jgi:hypothetical protein
MAATIGIVGAVAGVAQAGSSILGGIGASKAAGSAAAAQQAELDKAMQFQQQVYGTAQAQEAPYITGGQGAVQGLETFLGLPGGGGPTGSGALASFNQFAKTPYYTFPLSQATDTMDRAAAAKGMSLSGGQVADLGKYASGYASSNFMDYIKALQGLAGMGQTGISTLGQIGGTAGGQVGQTASGLAASASSGIQGQQAGTNKALGGVGDLLKAIGGTGSLFGGSGDTSSSYTPASFGNETGFTTGGFQGGNVPIVPG